MKHFLKREELATDKHCKLYDITENVETAVFESKICEGHILLQSVHATTGLYVNENEPRLLDDFVIYLNRQAPRGNEFYLHDNIAERNCPDDEPENGHSHIKATFYSSPSIGLVLNDKKMLLGKYQRIFFAEFDGPCPRKHKSKRNYLISIIGE
jgi:secondary thiamine-phosphate synthase enzyme